MYKRTCKIIAGIMTITFLSSIGGIGGYRVKAEAIGKDAIINYIVNKAAKNLNKKQTARSFNDNLPRKHTNPEESIRVIVELEDKPILQNQALENKTEKNLKMEINSRKKEVSLQKVKQDKVIQKVSQIKGTKVGHRYNYLVNGFSLTVRRSEIDKIKSIPGVKKVTEAKVYKQDMTSAKTLTKVYDAWNNTGLKGEGMVVAIIDTGIDYYHKDMKLTNISKGKLNKDSAVLDNNDPGKFFTDKIPYGYNFADKNQDIIDRSISMHGMHVAGIVGANGSDAEVKKNKAIQGVAPESQLLAMKVFSNSPDGAGMAFSDDIVAAIDASVTHGADVINMSIGSTAGFQDADDPEQIAIKNAVDNGVLVVTAAGNSYNSTYPNKFKGVVDTATVDAPGTAKDALTVASYENSNLICNALNYSTSKTPVAYFTSEINPVGVLTREYELVDCSLGTKEDFKDKDLTGKIALIKRGEISFIDKKLNAQEAKASGVIIYNNDKDETYVNMTADSEVKIPAIFIKNSDGLKLKKDIDKNVKISFSNRLITIKNAASDAMSDFTSWGPTPNLEFKPQISAPGGNIYSTVNNNQYEIMSGTSMATPHISGAEALILESLKKSLPDLKQRQLVEFAKTVAIQTAKVEMDKHHNDVPYSPRRQGSGLLQINNALKNKVLITDSNGNSTLALKQIEKNTVIPLKLYNYSDKSITYNLDNFGGAYTEIEQLLPTKNNPTPMSYEVRINGAAVTFDNNTVEVPANGEASVKVSINLPDNFKSEQFVEGYIRFISQDANIPELIVPYIGFYGDWSKPLIIDSPMWKKASIYNYTGVYSDLNGITLPSGITGISNDGSKLLINENSIAFSPNGDMLMENAMPVLEFLRNSKELSIEILNSKKNIIRQIALDNNIAKDNYDGSGPLSKPEWFWDGTVYNARKGKYVTAPEGQYYIRVSSKIDFESAKEQKLVMPVKLDLTAPELNVVSSSITNKSKYTLRWTAQDISGIMFDAQAVLLNSNETPEESEIKFEDEVYTIEVNLIEGENNIKIAALDSAGNPQIKEFKVNCDTVAPIAPQILVSTTNITNKNVIVTMTPNISDNDVSGLEYSLDKDVWNKYTTSFEVEANTKVYGRVVDNSGNFSDLTEVDITNIDKTAPIVRIKGVEDNAIYNDNIKIQVEVEDFTNTNLVMKLDGSEYKGEEIDVEGQHKLEVSTTDSAGNITEKSIKFTIDKTIPSVTIGGIIDGGKYNKNVTPLIKIIDVSDTTLTMKLDGKEYKGETIDLEGNHKLVVNAADSAGNLLEKEINFTIDKTPPIINIEGITDGSEYDNKAALKIQVNEGILEMFLDGKPYKGENIISLGTHELIINAVDDAGNKTTNTVKFSVRAALDNTNEVCLNLVDSLISSNIDNVQVKLNNTSFIMQKFFEAVANNSELMNSSKILSFAIDSSGVQIEYSFKLKDINKNNIHGNIDLTLNEVSTYKDDIIKINDKVQILSFKDNGILPAPFTIRVKLDSSKIDLTKPVYFQYYNPTTKNIEMINDRLVIDKDGFTEVTIKHASDYLFSNVYVEKQAGGVSDTPDNDSSNDDKEIKQLGSMIDNKILVVLGLLLSGTGFILLIINRKKKYHS